MTDHKNDGGPAFPSAYSYKTAEHLAPGEIGLPVDVTVYSRGATLRDYFAAKALEAMELKHDGRYSPADHLTGLPETQARWAATAAYRYADAMLRAREAHND